jgi:hypothetical protein
MSVGMAGFLFSARVGDGGESGRRPVAAGVVPISCLGLPARPDGCWTASGEALRVAHEPRAIAAVSGARLHFPLDAPCGRF